ncbi:hypothetical protein GCM10020295_37440 [Streptomyces cinereospinus]
MSDDNPAARAIPPRWMPIGEEPELCSAGEWWDAVRAVEAVGRRAIEILNEGDEPVGPVILDHGGPEPRLYFLVPVGTAVRWGGAGDRCAGTEVPRRCSVRGEHDASGDALARLPPRPAIADAARCSAPRAEPGSPGAAGGPAEEAAS